MKKVLIILAIMATVTAGGLMLMPRDGKCAFCPSYACINSNSCGIGCFCVKRGFSTTGECVSVD